jgi:hypothetical protein
MRSRRIGILVGLVLLAGGCRSDNDGGERSAHDGAASSGGAAGSGPTLETPAGTGGRAGTDGAPGVAPPPGVSTAGLGSGGTPSLGEGGRGLGDAAGPGPTGCVPVKLEGPKDVSGYLSDVFTWSDAVCRPRSAALVRNDAQDPAGQYGGHARRMTYEVDGAVRSCEGNDSTGWHGFGYIVAHYGGGAATTRTSQGTFTTLLAGRHHAIHEYRWQIQPGGNVDVTVHWFFATGRSNPVYAVTYDATPAGPNVVSADSRAPYGDIAWGGSNVDGVGWGDAYQLTTTGSGPLTPASGWDYTRKNVVPYDVAWSNSADAEMGLVSTLPWSVRISGGDYGSGVLGTKWGKAASSGLLDDSNLPNWLWPFQLNQYELPYTTASHRLAWGMSYGAVGQKVVNEFGRTNIGYPLQSYSVYVVLGKHSTSAVADQVAEIDATQNAIFSATKGTVASDGPAGPRRTDRTTYVPRGFNPVYGVWEVAADNGAASVRFQVTRSRLVNPVILVTDFPGTTAPRVSSGGRTLTPDMDYFATVDPKSHRVFVTLNATVSGTLGVDVQ